MVWAWVGGLGMLAPVAVLAGAPRRLTGWLRAVTGRPAVPRPSRPPVERIAADLRRLSGYLDRLDRSREPAKIARMRAASWAYDDVLIEACRALEVPVDVGHAPLRPAERLFAEIELSRAGLVW